MGSLRFNDFSNSPAILLSPQHHQSFNDPIWSQPYHRTHYHTYKAIMPDESPNYFDLASRTPSTPLKIVNPRKRARSEISDDAVQSIVAFSKIPAVNPEPIYGEGMVLINPSTGVATSAESQTGTWLEDKLEAELRAAAKTKALEEANVLLASESVDRPALPMRKCPRRDTSWSLAAFDKPHHDDMALPTMSRPEDPAIDAFTHLLGVGWARVSADADMQAAARGYAKYIENHYPLSSVEIVSKSRGLDAYLVQTTGGFYLFKEDLSEGQLVGSTWDVCARNLQLSPMGFEGIETLKAVRTPDAGQVMSDGVSDKVVPSSVNASASNTSVEDGGMDID